MLPFVWNLDSLGVAKPWRESNPWQIHANADPRL
jgi:hypothetical protein